MTARNVCEVAIALILGMGPLAVSAQSPAIECSELSGLTFEGNTKIASSEVVSGSLTTPDGLELSDLPEFCRATGHSKPTDDSDIYFEVWLPATDWNGRFLSSGEGGFAGRLNYTRKGLDGGMDEMVRRGYVTASTDTGHSADEEFWAVGHPERVVDYAYRAKHLVTVAAKGLTERYYGTPPEYSYYNSCSNGGRQALLEMQLYPDDFDGAVVGAPWAYQSHANASYIWSAQALAAPDASIPEAKLPSIAAASLGACDEIDGVKDGLIEDPRACDFEPASLICESGDADDCLTQPQFEALEKLYAGPSNPRTGESIYSGWAPGGEADWGNIVTNGSTLRLGLGYFANLVFEDPKWTFDQLDFDEDIAVADEKIGAIADANIHDLQAAKAQGAKILMFHGWNDQVIPPGYAIDYYEKVADNNGGVEETKDFMRLFMVPGMTHCYFGPGAASFGGVGQQIPPTRDPEHDVQKALEAWVEGGDAPDSIIATKYADDAPATAEVASTRLLCMYPEVAKYNGGGDTSDAADYICAAP